MEEEKDAFKDHKIWKVKVLKNFINDSSNKKTSKNKNGRRSNSAGGPSYLLNRNSALHVIWSHFILGFKEEEEEEQKRNTKSSKDLDKKKR